MDESAPVAAQTEEPTAEDMAIDLEEPSTDVPAEGIVEEIVEERKNPEESKENSKVTEPLSTKSKLAALFAYEPSSAKLE